MGSREDRDPMIECVLGFGGWARGGGADLKGRAVSIPEERS